MDIGAALDFVTANHHAVLATARRNGRPQLSPVVVAVLDGAACISTRASLVKVHNIERDPLVSLVVTTDAHFGPWVQLDGTAEIERLPEAMDGLVALYRSIVGEHPDWDDFRDAMHREQRVLLRIRPDHAAGTLESPPTE